MTLVADPRSAAEKTMPFPEPAGTCEPAGFCFAWRDGCQTDLLTTDR
jgi:hypothetical protein